MGLLNYLTATSLDEDYAHVSKQRATVGAPARRSPGTVGLVVLAVFGVLVATAAVQTSRNADESASSRESLVNQVNSRKAELDAKRARATSLTRSVAALQNSNLDATNEGRAVRSRLDRLGTATGSVAAKGQGIRVVVDDAPNATTDKQQVLDRTCRSSSTGCGRSAPRRSRSTASGSPASPRSGRAAARSPSTSCR